MILLFTGFTLQAYPAAAVPPVVTVKNSLIKNDTSKLSVRNFDAQQLKQYRESNAFKYDETTPDNLWDRFWKWFWEQINFVLKNERSGSILKYLVIGVLAVAVIYIVIKLTGLDMKIILRKPKAVPLRFSEAAENIHEINFNEEIQQAIANTNYRLAVRLCYLYTLKKLNDQSLINWQPEKTNHTYIQEIQDPAVKKQFSLLTTQFEYIWYGEFFIDKESFTGLKNDFDLFNPKKS